MSTIRRMSRYRREDAGDAIVTAWDMGNPPPPEAYLPTAFDTVAACVFVRWSTHKPDWTGPHHPYASAWHDALLASRAMHMRRSRRRAALPLAAVADADDTPDAAA